jgi:hypothetical protein
MKTVTQYREDMKALSKKLADIDTKCVAENREYTEAELSLKKELMDTIEDIQKIVATMERQERIQRALDGPAQAAQTVVGPTGKKTPADSRPQDRFSSFGEWRP